MKKLINDANMFFEKNKKQIAVVQKFKQEQKNVLNMSSKDSSQIDELFNKIQLQKDFVENISSIKILTNQIKSIQKQHVLLIGEKIFRVRALIQEMEEGNTTFSSWVSLVFPTKSSAYNALAYYEFFIRLPNDQSRQVFQAIPYKAAYILAARKGSYDKKTTILQQIIGKNNQDAIQIININFPSSKSVCINLNQDHSSRNKVISEKLLSVVKEINDGLHLSEYNINLLKHLISLLNLY